MIIREHPKLLDRWGKVYVEKYNGGGARAASAWLLQTFSGPAIMGLIRPYIKKWFEHDLEKKRHDNEKEGA